MSKYLVMISNNIAYKSDIRSFIKQKYSFKDIEIFTQNTDNLVDASLEYVEEFKKGYSKGIIFWITGVAVTNILNKEITNVNTIQVPHTSFLKDLLKEKKIDIMVLGEMLIGYKNIEYIVELFMEEVNGNS